MVRLGSKDVLVTKKRNRYVSRRSRRPGCKNSEIRVIFIEELAVLPKTTYDIIKTLRKAGKRENDRIHVPSTWLTAAVSQPWSKTYANVPLEVVALCVCALRCTSSVTTMRQTAGVYMAVHEDEKQGKVEGRERIETGQTNNTGPNSSGRKPFVKKKYVVTAIKHAGRRRITTIYYHTTRLHLRHAALGTQTTADRIGMGRSPPVGSLPLEVQLRAAVVIND